MPGALPKIPSGLLPGSTLTTAGFFPFQEPSAPQTPTETEEELEGQEEDLPSEAEGLGAPVPKRARLANGTDAPEETESGGTDSGQENSGEPRLLRSGTYGDRTETKAYGSITHKCEVRSGKPVW